MQAADLVENVQQLSDLELAILLSLVAGQHCMIETEEDAVESLIDELQLTVSSTFGLSPTVIRCSKFTTPEQLSNDVLTQTGSGRQEADPPGNATQVNQSTSQAKSTNVNRGAREIRSTRSEKLEDDDGLADIIILKDLGLTIYPVQIQVLELIRTKRMFSHTAVRTAPKLFGIIILQADSNLSLNKHLIDHIFISHYHDQNDGFPNLEEASDWIEDDHSSAHSVVHRTTSKTSLNLKTIRFPVEDILNLIDLTEEVTVSAEIEVYVQNIVTFLRLHRAVGGGISPRATQHFDLLMKCLAPLHGLDFVTPSLVALAARKIYPHRLSIVSAPKERSMQYGSNLASVANLLRNCTPESVIEEVLVAVEAPL